MQRDEDERENTKGNSPVPIPEPEPEPDLEVEWRTVCKSLESFLDGLRTPTVFLMRRLQPETIKRLSETYQLEVSEWIGSHMISRRQGGGDK